MGVFLFGLTQFLSWLWRFIHLVKLGRFGPLFHQIFFCTSHFLLFPNSHHTKWDIWVCFTDSFSFVIVISLLPSRNDDSSGPCIWCIYSFVSTGFFFSILFLLGSLQHLFFGRLPIFYSVLRHFACYLLKHFYNSHFKVLSDDFSIWVILALTLVGFLCCVFSCNLKLPLFFAWQIFLCYDIDT